MRLFHNPIRAVTALLAVLTLAAPVTAGARDADRTSTDRTAADRTNTVSIENFGRVNDTYYRGGEPEGNDFAELAAAGIKTIIDLRNDGDQTDTSAAARVGLKVLRLPMSSTQVPNATQIDQFLRLVNDPANQPVYVHCVGGRHRTGTLTAVYRMTQDGWTADRAFQEMQRYDFEYGFGHGGQKKFVYRFGADLDRTRLASTTASKAVTQQ